MIKDQISVLMAVYNCEKTVQQAIDSILAQTYQNWIMIICDDCSTDNTLSVVKEYERRYPEHFKIIQNEKNSKLAFSLNHCLEYADGEFCARMDGDDYVAPERFEKQVEYLRAHPEIQLVSTWMQVFNDDGLGRVVKYKEFPNKTDLHKGPCFAHATIMTYTSIYNQLGGYTVSTRTTRLEDYDLWFRFFAKGFQGACIQEALYYVRENYQSFVRRKSSLYFWAIATRYIGFKTVGMPARYHVWILFPLIGLFGNKVRIVLYKFFKHNQGT